MYLEQCSGYSNADIDLAVKQFLSGSVKGVSAGWAPTTAQFAQQLRANLDYRASSVQSHNRLLEQFKEREEDEEWAAKRTPEARAKVKSMLDAIAEKEKTRTPEEIAQAKAALAKHDALYADEFIESPTGVKVSTHLVEKLRGAGYTTFNAADDENYDMGDGR